MESHLAQSEKLATSAEGEDTPRAGAHRVRLLEALRPRRASASGLSNAARHRLAASPARRHRRAQRLHRHALRQREASKGTGTTSCSPSPATTPSICNSPTTATRSRMPTPASTGTPKPCATPRPSAQEAHRRQDDRRTHARQPRWQNAAAHELTLLPPLHTLPRKTTIRLLYDEKALHLRAEAELGDATDSPPSTATAFSPTKKPSTSISPRIPHALFYRLTHGANAASKYDALNGRITDVMDPRHGKDDPTWNGDWTSETRRCQTTLARPSHHPLQPSASSHPRQASPGKPTSAATTPCPARRSTARSGPPRSAPSMDDRSVMGEIVFE